MKIWKIPVVWQEMGTIEVAADTLADAMNIAKDEDRVIPLPDNGYYLDDTWELATDDMALVRECYNANQEDER